MRVLYLKYIRQLLYSPLSYFSGVLFVLFCTLNFFLGRNFFSPTGSTELHSFFYGIPYICILVIPLLNSACGTSKNEFSLPYHALEIYAAKIFSVFTVLAFFLLLTFLLPICVSKAGALEWSAVFCAYVIALFYLLSSSSLTVFIFSVFENKGAAFFASVFILAVLNSIHELILFVPFIISLAPAVRFFSLAWHFDAAAKGILDSRDIAFFLFAAAMFYALSVFVMEKKRGNRLLGFKKFFLLFIFTALLFVLDTSLLYFRIDITKQKKFSLSAYSKLLLSEVDQPLSITYYRNKELVSLLPQVRDVDEYLSSFSRSQPYAFYKLVDPIKEKKEKVLESFNVYPQNVRTSSKATTSISAVYSAIIIEYLGKSEVIPFVANAQTLEYQLCVKLNSLVRSDILAAQVLCANEFELEKNYAFVPSLLQSQGFTVLRTCLPSEIVDSSESEENDALDEVQVPFTRFPDVPLVVLGTSSFTVDDSNELLRFIKNGGKVFIASTPYSVDMTTWQVKQNSIDWGIRALQELGLYYKQTLTADSKNFRINFDSSNDSDGQSQKSEFVNYSYWPLLPAQDYASQGMVLTWPSAIEIEASVAEEENFIAKPVLLTDETSWQSKKVRGEFITNPFSVSKKAEKGEECGVFNVAVELINRGKENPSVIVFGDQYCFSANILPYISSEQMLDMRSLDFILNSVLRLGDNNELLSLKNKNFIDTSLYKIKDGSFLTYKKRTLGFSCGCPLILLLLICLLVYQKRKLFNSRGKK